MKKLLFLLFLLTFLLCGCLPSEFFSPHTITTTNQETINSTPETTTLEPEVTTSEPEVTTSEPEVTTSEPEVTTSEPEVTTPEELPCEHLFEFVEITKEPTCIQVGTYTVVCSCGVEETREIPVTDKHNYVDNKCTWCQKDELVLVPIASQYDADGDGQKDIYYFAAEPAQRCAEGVWLWAGNYDKGLSGTINKTAVTDVQHWYVGAESAEKLVYRVSVPESGMYEMILHMRLKDGTDRGAKYTFNAGASIEQTFETSHAFDSTSLNDVRNETEGTYMYGIFVYLQGGENIFSIECASQSSKTQHYREFYFVKVNEGHSHNFESIGVTKQPTCHTVGEQTLVCSCGETNVIFIPTTSEHSFENGICTLCGEVDIPLYASNSAYDADGDGQKDIYYFSPQQNNASKEGIHVWAGDYDKTLSVLEKPLIVGGHQHCYVSANSTQQIIYYVTVPESGVYEMILHMRLKDGAERGAKYTINEGGEFEQVFETSHTFDDTTLTAVSNETVGTYMYGIRVALVAGKNTIKITCASSSSRTQHFRDFYFVKVGEFHQHDYLLRSVISQPTCAVDGKIAFLCACGAKKTVVIPATKQHTYIDEFCTVCGQEPLRFGIVDYTFLSPKAGFVGGVVSLLPEFSGVYTLYWGDENGKLPDYTMLGSVIAYAHEITEFSIYESTAIPAGATCLLAVDTSGGRYIYSFVIPAERRLTAEKLYTFGALSDTHQGTRYGPESLPYERLVNAGEILSEKDAILIGINGDISYINLEFEYVLHANAVKEIFEFAPDMPVFTTTGNHESRAPYPFDKEMYIKYTRNLADYDSDLSYIFSDGNDLDYVIELPDGSVIIFLHQVYYDYGKPDSRLMDDYQLDWLGNRLEQYKDRTVFLFFHSQMQGKVGDFNDHSTSLEMTTNTEDYKRLDAYFKQYTNVVFFNGHTHSSFDNVFSKDYGDRVFNSYDGNYATLVHIPSLAQSQLGHIVHVYEDCIVFEGYHFGKEQTFAYATFIIEK